jgi:hypothetical protein
MYFDQQGLNLVDASGEESFFESMSCFGTTAFAQEVKRGPFG